jgi:hypothetical protein
MRRLLASALLSFFAFGCGVGEGEGEVQSERLYIENCWNGHFDLGPDFFAANPEQKETLLIRVQRGDNIEEMSDGLSVLVTDLQTLRGQLEQPIKVGLPPGVKPPGIPVVFDPDPPKVSLHLYLHRACQAQNATVHALSGQIVFHSLFSGDPNESNGDARLTDAEFTGTFGDPRLADPLLEPDPMVMSTVTGHFRFYFHRGQPAQPFQ